MNIVEELKKYDYKDVFRYFAEISEIPRGSGNMERISAFLYDFGRRLGYETYTDSAKNVIIRRPASAGYEAHEPVVLQGHMDMVCVSEPDCKHDFENNLLSIHLISVRANIRIVILKVDNSDTTVNIPKTYRQKRDWG